MIRFLHIPKTAGTSFKHALLRVYRYGSHFEFDGNLVRDLDRLSRLSDKELRNLKVILGHSPRCTGNKIIDDAPCITFFRDPLSRVKSFCQHVSEGKSRYLVTRFPPEHFNVSDLIGSDCKEIENLHTRLLVGDLFYEKESEQSIYDRAVHVLEESIDVCGIVEKFDDSLMLFKHVFSWERDPFYLYHNHWQNKKELIYSADNLKILIQKNQIDYRLYSIAKKRFECDIGSINNLSDKVNAFRDANNLHKRSLMAHGYYRKVLGKVGLLPCRF